MKPTTALLAISGLALTGLVMGAKPSTAQSPAPQITIQGLPAAKAPAAGKSAEVLPWANKPLTPMASVSGEDYAATEAAAAQCSGLFEAACRDLKTCAWVADVALVDGTLVPARCAARPPAPPKKAAKKKAPPKKAAKVSDESETTTAAPPAKAVVTRVEDDEPAAAPKAVEKKVEQTKTAVTTEPKAPEPPPAAEKAPPAEVEKKEPEQAAKKEVEDKADAVSGPGPVVVTPPTPPTPPKMPSFGSISPIMPGAGDAVVVTVPPSQ